MQLSRYARYFCGVSATQLSCATDADIASSTHHAEHALLQLQTFPRRRLTLRPLHRLAGEAAAATAALTAASAFAALPAFAEEAAEAAAQSSGAFNFTGAEIALVVAPVVVYGIFNVVRAHGASLHYLLAPLC